VSEPLGLGLEEPPDREGAFPRLDDDQRARLRAVGEMREVEAGEILFREGDESYDFFVVESGAVVIVRGYGEENRVIAVHGPHRFLGELSLLTGSRVYLTAVVRDPGEVIQVPVKRLRKLALEDRDLDVLTVEVSSFQLETISTFRPSIGIWLNFAPDHLDRYRSVAEYRAAKLRIFENQTAEDVAVINAGEALPKIAARTLTFSAYTNQADFRLEGGSIVYENRPVLRMAETKLRGLHNIENIMATLAAGLARGLTFEQMVPPLQTYEPRPHRCEFVREVGGVAYVNDSKATNLDAVEKALLAQNRKVILIAGGKDKGFTFETLRELVSEKSRAVILIGEMATRICRDWQDADPSEIANSVADAGERAQAVAQSGEVVLFTAGASSFDVFQS